MRVLAEVTPSPIVELNRAVAVAMADGPAAGLAIVDALTAEPSLKAYHLLPSVRGDLLVKLGRLAEAKPEFERAAAMTRNIARAGPLVEAGAGVRGGVTGVAGGTAPPSSCRTSPPRWENGSCSASLNSQR